MNTTGSTWTTFDSSSVVDVERSVVAFDAHDLERPLAADDQLLGDFLARLHHAHEERGRADRDLRNHAALDVDRNFRIVGSLVVSVICSLM